MNDVIKQLTDEIYATVFASVEKKYLQQAKSFSTWIKTLKDLRGEETYLNAEKSERLAMADLLGFKPNHLALASNSDENIAKRALRDAEVRFEKLRMNIKRILTDLDAVVCTRVVEKQERPALKFLITSEQGNKHLLQVTTVAVSNPRYSNIVRTTLDVTTLD